MNKLTHFSILISVFIILHSCSPEEESTHNITNYTDSLSYSLGMTYAQKLPDNLQQNGLDSISFTEFIRGFQDYFDTTQANILSDEEIISITEQFLQLRQKRIEQAFLDSHKVVNIDKGNAFLEKNKEKRGIKGIEKGLQYETLYRGWGQQKPRVNDTVLVSYKIYSIDNTLLFNSEKISNNPIPVTLDSAILAWQKVIPLFVTGGRMKIFASPEFAYGSSYSQEKGIKPYSTLIFEVTLHKFIRSNIQEETTTSDPIQPPEAINVEPPAQEQRQSSQQESVNRGQSEDTSTTTQQNTQQTTPPRVDTTNQ
ncbi:MAG: FKBP-type peptidyl-prolyl cis-trans isomerase [Bacteroidales bacterium]|nr:FKBP-type peptidyl-prolyl cis-trans isomerase [Bacteroidales bacterium]